MPKKMVADEMMVVMWMLDRCSLFMPSDSFRGFRFFAALGMTNLRKRWLWILRCAQNDKFVQEMVMDKKRIPPDFAWWN